VANAPSCILRDRQEGKARKTADFTVAHNPLSTVNHMSTGTILLIVLVVLLIGALPTWPHSRSWGYWPGGMVGTVLLILVVLLLMGRL
jgi:uncharacterized membrane protein YdcZ (DUF606 family)